MSPAYSLLLKNTILFLNRDLISFPNGHICNVVSTLPNAVKIDLENSNVVSTWSNRHINLKTTLNRRFQPLTIITKRSILDVAAALDPSLIRALNMPDYAWIIPKYAWICLNIPDCGGVHVKIYPKGFYFNYLDVFDLLLF